jgi:hypothetical protein
LAFARKHIYFKINLWEKYSLEAVPDWESIHGENVKIVPE